jgi:hypothetical protein
MWVRLNTGGVEMGMGNVTNVSFSGAFLETTLQLPVGAGITLEPTSLAGAALEGLKITARVVRVDQRGVGLEWRVELTPDILALLGVVVPPSPFPWPIQRRD